LFLSSLDIFGFKSFAEKTHIEFAEGITALLGPNGCGKSNVVDAIKWVIGEQSARAMRAESMEDVIFNGTETRKPLNVAEVTLTLANDSGLLPIDMPEVQIRRRLYRSGESEYYINNQQVRLKEVRELFWDTGVGKVAYSVMEQGKIDQALSSKPEERRYIFDEAAGINRSKAKNREAEQKIARFEEHIKQLNFQLAETKKSYDALKIQSEKTLKYRAVRDEIFGFERDAQLLRLKSCRDSRDARGETIRKMQTERDNVNASLAQITASVTENMDLVNALEAEQVEAQKALFGLAKEKQGLENEARLLAEQRADIKNQISQNEGRERALGIKIEELEEDAAAQDDEAQGFHKKAEAIEQNIVSFDANIKLTAGNITTNEGGIAKCEGDIAAFGEAQSGLELELESITTRLVAELDAGLKDAGYSAAGRRDAESALAEGFDKLRTLLAGRAALAGELAAAAGRSGEGGAGVNPAELQKISASLSASFTEAASLSEHLKTLFAAYKASTPVFIDEFLSPQGIVTKKREIDAQIAAQKEGVKERRERIAALRKENEGLSVKIDEYRQTLQDLRVQRAQITAQAVSAAEHAKLLRREIASQSAQRKALQDDVFLGRKRLGEIDERITDSEEGLADIERRGHELAANMEKLEKDIDRRNGELSGKRDEITKRNAELARINSGIEREQLELVRAETEIKNIQDNFRETHSRDLMEFEERIYQITTPISEIRENLTAAKEALRGLGQPNLMAPEEFKETKERYDFLSGQIDDLLKARENEEKVAAEIRAESTALFMETYNKIKRNFHNMFRRLFGGGRAELRLTDPNHALESGIEIYAQPPGKKQENISLLSGGEKSMTAVALLFATYMVKPSPFCLLDEIDAALDEDNVGRFTNMLAEFGRASQFIIITHNKKTVLGASTLLGVTQNENGVTTMVAIRVENRDEARRQQAQAAAAPSSNFQPFEEEDVLPEEGRELPPDVDDPAAVPGEVLRPIKFGGR
jgi:chromosome segregation protein